MSWVRFGGKLGGAALLLLLATSLGAQAAPADPQAGDLAGYVEAVAEGAGVILSDPGVVTSDPGAVVSPITSPREPDAPGDEPAPREPGFADRVSAAFEDHLLVASAAGVGVALAGMAAFALVGRYVDPKEALENPQRSMLYGFIRGHPGVHLKKLSDEFGMKTSSILWHIRKLEGAQLVRSDRANGYRVFYPVEGGVKARETSRAIANLRNANALRIFEALERRPGVGSGDLVRELGLHGGTARWHLRRMRDAGLLEELVGASASRLFPTELGRRALQAAQGERTTPAAPKPVAFPGLNAASAGGDS